MDMSVNRKNGISLPVTREFIDVLGIRTAFYRSVSGEQAGASKGTIVLAHGGAPGVSAELNWFRNFGVLAGAGYTVIAYDQPGFGYSGIPDDHGIEFRYQHMVAFLNSLAIDSVHLCGNSIGGLLCSLYALRAPKGVRVSSLILSAPFPYFDPPAIVEERLLAHRSRLGSIEPTFESIKKLCLNTFNQPAQVTDSVVQLRLDMLEGERWDAYKARAGSRAFDRDTLRGRRVDTPTLLVWGVEDRSLPYEIGIEAMQHYSHGRFLFLTQAGHWPQTEQSQAFNEAAVGFLDALS